MAKPENVGIGIDVAELFGGEGGVGKLCIRRRLRRGRNFDLVIGFDLVNEEQQEQVLSYFRKHKPLVVVLGPPCTGFGHWSHLNRYIHPDIWSNSRKTGECLAASIARVIRVQFDAGRHLIFENPAGLELFHLACIDAM